MKICPDITAPAPDNNAPKPPQPIVPMLPLPSNYRNASIDALIFLAVESNPKLQTEDAIVNEISKLSNGQEFSQSYISRRLREIRKRHIIARDKVWSILKHEGYYKLIDLDKEKEMERQLAYDAIPFDHSTVFRNDPINGTIFGFKIRDNCEDLTAAFDAADKYLYDLLEFQVFQSIRVDKTLYILLDSSHPSYRTTKARLNQFIDNTYLKKR